MYILVCIIAMVKTAESRPFSTACHSGEWVPRGSPARVGHHQSFFQTIRLMGSSSLPLAPSLHSGRCLAVLRGWHLFTVMARAEMLCGWSCHGGSWDHGM